MFVGNVKEGVTEDQLREIFSFVGEVRNVRILMVLKISLKKLITNYIILHKFNNINFIIIYRIEKQEDQKVLHL